MSCTKKLALIIVYNIIQNTSRIMSRNFCNVSMVYSPYLKLRGKYLAPCEEIETNEKLLLVKEVFIFLFLLYLFVFETHRSYSVY